MRQLFCFFLLLILVLPVWPQDYEFPKQSGAVTDYFNVVDKGTAAKIDLLARQLKRITSINLAVAIIPTTKPLTAETYGEGLYDRWDLGQKKIGLDHGVLILVSAIDREVKIIIGQGIDFLFTPEIKTELEMGLYPSLGKGKIADAVYLGAASVSSQILNEWPKYQSRRQVKQLLNIVLGFLALTLTAVILSVAFGGTYMTVFSTVVGGTFGFLFFGIPGLFIFGTIGLLLHFGGREKIATREETEYERIQKEWEKRRRGGKKQ